MKKTEESTKQTENYDIETILEQYHNNTEEDKNLPWQKWIPFRDHLPLDNNDYILVWNPKVKSFYDTRSFIALQHWLYSKYMKWENEATFWMRITIP